MFVKRHVNIVKRNAPKILLRYCNKSCTFGCQRQCSEQHSRELEKEHFCNCHHQCDKLCILPGIQLKFGNRMLFRIWSHKSASYNISLYYRNLIILFQLDEKDDNIQFCRPEACDEYCIRLGRGHNPAIECADEYLCYIFILLLVIIQNIQIYYDYLYQQQLNRSFKYFKAIHISNNLDHVLCKQFWEILGWDQPVRGIKKQR
ncbi:unnamed protein product [Paramecium sonneborni]|uniref:Uncharacterized protein n=1 Tax=Paramecium sonneborni TaxID=65129 RepID=A0A8S1MYL9_9CILI|nr:unnamed protein product [Paramecium sonneborni]